jgi:hypothetical protein
MSSSRSLASARNKRAAGNPNPTVPGNSAEQAPPVPAAITNQKSVPAKISLPQAIQRIGERLNNLELFAETTTKVVDEIQDFHTNTSDKYIVDADVFTSIVSRIEALEANTDKKSETITSTSTNIPDNITNDIDELKNHLIRLQTYVMKTNAKLQDIVFSTNGSSLVTFDDVFSDSHPTPSTLIKSANKSTIEEPAQEEVSVGSVELELDDNNEEEEVNNITMDANVE